ncbi:MAG: hypothetical protein AAGF14_00140 [Pseudomonadota bacterium]
MKKVCVALMFGLLVLAQPAASIAAEEIVPRDSLKGTIWQATDSHDRLTIDQRGKIERKEGKDIYIEFLDLADEVYAIKIHWWNVAAKINVLEYAVLVPGTANNFSYTEALHPPNSGFPGIQGHGTFRIIDQNSAELTQVGRLVDGSASAFVTTLKRVDKAPEISVPQTYPPAQ